MSRTVIDEFKQLIRDGKVKDLMFWLNDQPSLKELQHAIIDDDAKRLRQSALMKPFERLEMNDIFLEISRRTKFALLAITVEEPQYVRTRLHYHGGVMPAMGLASYAEKNLFEEMKDEETAIIKTDNSAGNGSKD